MRGEITMEEENMSLSFAGEIEFVVSYFRANTISFYILRLEYALEGSLNYISWKDRREVVLEDNELKELIYKDIPKPLVVDAHDLEKRRKCVEKTRRIIL